MRIDLQVPFAEKDDAKRLGARWDPARKLWYVENKADMSPFARWLPNPASAGGARLPQPAPAQKPQTKGLAIVGSNFVERPRVCDCLPWETCDKCRSAALSD